MKCGGRFIGIATNLEKDGESVGRDGMEPNSTRMQSLPWQRYLYNSQLYLQAFLGVPQAPWG